MTLEEVKAEVAELLELVSSEGFIDEAGAHEDEDNLMKKVIARFAEGNFEDAQAICQEIVKINDSDHTRWYA